jgi:hypothetical protein
VTEYGDLTADLALDQANVVLPSELIGPLLVGSLLIWALGDVGVGERAQAAQQQAKHSLGGSPGRTVGGSSGGVGNIAVPFLWAGVIAARAALARATRTSARARAAPGQQWTPCPKDRWGLGARFRLMRGRP